MYYQVGSSCEGEQSQADVKVLLDDQVTEEWSKQNPTHTQQVGDCPGVFILGKIRLNMFCYIIDQQSKSKYNQQADISINIKIL